MIVSTMRAMLDGAITSQQLQDHYLYLVGDGETLFSIGQALLHDRAVRVTSRLALEKIKKPFR
jgi:hypothetical protein